MSSWCHGDSLATEDCQQPPFPQVTQMCLQFAAPPLPSALRSSCRWREGHASTPASPQSSELPPKSFFTTGLCLVTSAQLLAGTRARGQTPTTLISRGLWTTRRGLGRRSPHSLPFHAIHRSVISLSFCFLKEICVIN